MPDHGHRGVVGVVAVTAPDVVRLQVDRTWAGRSPAWAADSQVRMLDWVMVHSGPQRLTN